MFFKTTELMKLRITPKLSIVAVFIIFVVTSIQGQTGIDGETGDRQCPDSKTTSNQTPARDLLRKLRTDNTDLTTCEAKEDLLALLKADKSVAKPFNKEDPSWVTPANHPQTQADDAQELAKKLSNPIASLISFPFQSNFDFGMGPERKGYRYTLNIQPVIPFALTKDLNVISRTILPVIAQEDVVGTTGQAGLGDTIQSFFFSPNKTEPFIWGVGPQLLIPTATNEFLGTQKFGMGPTFVILKQKKGWTYGALVNHTWSVFGKDSRPPVNSTFLQPFLSYTTKNAWTFSFNTESAYDWSGNQWNVPIHFQVSKLMKMGKQPVSVGIASRCWAVSGPGGPQGCGFRLVFVPLFPVK